MIQCKEIQQLEAEHLKTSVPDFRVGDTVNVYTKIVEGEKERIQLFSGIVIARKGSGLSETFSLYRVSYGAGMERVFMLHSPRIAKIELIKRGKSRRAKLYNLRGASGKSAKIKEDLSGSRASSESKAPATQAEPAT